MTEDTAELIKKYSIGAANPKTIKFKIPPDLMILVDNQLETNYSLIPKGVPMTDEGKIGIDVACWDHHIISDGEYISDFRNDNINSTTSIIISSFLTESHEKYIEFLKDDCDLCTIGYQGLLVDTGLKESILVKEDKQAHDFFQKYSANIVYIHNLNQNKISEATASILAKAYQPGSMKNIGDMFTYCYIPKIKEGQIKELAIVADEVLRISTSRPTSIVAGVMQESDYKENILRISIRSYDPSRIFNAKTLAEIYNGGGNRYKAAAQIGLGILKYSIDIPESENLISEEIVSRFLGSDINPGDKLKKKTLVDPAPLESIINENEIKGNAMALIGNAAANYSLRGNNHYVTLFANKSIESDHDAQKQLEESDIISLFKIEDLYLRTMEKSTQFRSCKASVIYGLINGEVEPYIIGIVSVKNKDNNNDSRDSEILARNIFGDNISEFKNMEQAGLKRTVARVPLQFLQYTSQHPYLHKIIYNEIEERLSKVLGDKSNVQLEE